MAITFSLPNFGLGCAPLGGNGGVFSMASDAAADQVVHHALANGVTFFDTAPAYGAGLSEQRLGRALAGVPRHAFQIGTKIGGGWLTLTAARNAATGVTPSNGALMIAYNAWA